MSERASSSSTLLAEVLPKFDASEVHGVWVPAPPAVAFEAVKKVTVREVRLLVPLMGLRGLPRLLTKRPGFRPRWSTPVLEALLEVGFVDLGERPGGEIVAGAVGRFWRPAGNEPLPVASREDFLAFAEPGYAKAAVGFVVRPERGGCCVVTETRIVGTSPDATHAFLRYWRVIRHGSGAIRRSWLGAIRRRAVRAG
jgi:hypothetical protein